MRQLMRLFFAGIAGGLTLNLVMLLTFRYLGFGWNGGGILLDPSLQSPKLIAVWTQMDPRPLVVSCPIPIVIGFCLFGIGHAFVYQLVGTAWPAGVPARTWRLAALLFFLTFAFWEFFTPYNLFGEPLPLISLELIFWAVIAITEATVITSVLEWHRDHRIELN